MDGAVVNSNTIIAAGAVVLEGTICEAGSIYAGVPAKKVKDIPQEMISGEIDRIANNYVRYAIGSEWKKLQKMDDLLQKETFETLAARTFTLANAIFAS
jgi:Carbonic anhydrases/acetyltransferases, isoleucine patch superfamily